MNPQELLAGQFRVPTHIPVCVTPIGWLADPDFERRRRSAVWYLAARSEGIEPSSRVLEARLQPLLERMALRTRIELVSFLRQRNCDTSRITKHQRSRRESNAHRFRLGGGAPNPSARAWGDARVMLPSEGGSQPPGFNLLPRVTVGAERIELS